eukprot:m.266265 g.266265  ORF g.266265 m.266265 type:complete len:154 (+) comp15628_c0_seq2:112-573(+)
MHGCVDRVDQCRSYNTIRIKQLRRYYLQVVFDTLDAVIHNVRIIYNDTRPEGVKKLTSGEFRNQLVRQLCPDVFNGPAAKQLTQAQQTTQITDLPVTSGIVHDQSALALISQPTQLGHDGVLQPNSVAHFHHNTHHTPGRLQKKVCVHCKDKS